MATQKTVDKWKLKKWFNLYAPKILGEEVIGEIPAAEDKAVIGRLVKVSLSWITKNPSHSFMNVGLRIKSADGNSARTEIDYLGHTYSYVHSLVKRRASAIYTIDKLKDKEGKSFVLKLIVVTRNSLATSRKTELRKKLQDFVNDYASKFSREEIVKAVIDGAFQNESIKAIGKIAPINKLEVKKLEL